MPLSTPTLARLSSNLQLNAHVNAHVISGDAFLTAWHGA